MNNSTQQTQHNNNTTTTSKASSSSSSSSSSNNNNKLRDGPCSNFYELLETCQQRFKAQKLSNAMTLCVSETDLLIKCIKKHPLYFHSTTSSVSEQISKK